MEANGTFTTHDFTGAPVTPAVDITTGLGVGVATMEKRYTGEVSGRSATLFTSAFDPETGVGSYLAMESFEGRLGERAGTFNFAHVASTGGHDRINELFFIVPASGTGELAGITGTGSIVIDPDGTHRVHFDYTMD